MRKVRISDVIKESIVDGPGVRYVIFFQGCAHHCEGCHNPQTWDFNQGRDVDITSLIEDIRSNKLIKGVTFSGGDPIYQAELILPLAKELKSLGYNIVLYTGFLWEEIKSLEVIKFVDYVIDGCFVQSLKTMSMRFIGSTNQRIIDVVKSLEKDSVIEAEL